MNNEELMCMESNPITNENSECGWVVTNGNLVAVYKSYEIRGPKYLEFKTQQEAIIYCANNEIELLNVEILPMGPGDDININIVVKDVVQPDNRQDGAKPWKVCNHKLFKVTGDWKPEVPDYLEFETQELATVYCITNGYLIKNFVHDNLNIGTNEGVIDV